MSAAEYDEANFGRVITYLQNDEMRPVASRLALNPTQHNLFVLNPFDRVFLHRGFTFSTETYRFSGAWGPDNRVCICVTYLNHMIIHYINLPFSWSSLMVACSCPY